MTLPRIILERQGMRVVRRRDECQLIDHYHHRDRDRHHAHECEWCFEVEVQDGTDAMNQPVWRNAAADDGYRLASALKQIAIASEKEDN